MSHDNNIACYKVLSGDFLKIYWKEEFFWDHKGKLKIQ